MSEEPRILHCPRCGAPLEAPCASGTTQCGYCGQTLKLDEPSVPPMRPVPQLPFPVTVTSRGAMGPFVVVMGAMVISAALVGSVIIGQRPKAIAKPLPQAESVVVPPPPAPPPVVRYPLSALLNVNTALDIDASLAHMQGLFPAVDMYRTSDLHYRVPVDHPWFNQVELVWENRSGGKLITVAFNPPGQQLENQAEIAGCLSRDLGKPTVHEVDHFAHELNYRWDRPRAIAIIYSSYLGLHLKIPKGDAPLTLAQLVRTLDGCVMRRPQDRTN